jgi:phosphoribosyl 1,2-cyclic phosphate phosphodiesterase
MGPSTFVHGPDVLIAEFHPITGERRIHVEHPLLCAEATFAETLDIVRILDARQVVLSHIEEMDGLTYDDLLEVEQRLHGERRNIKFAYDTMLIEP